MTRLAGPRTAAAAALRAPGRTALAPALGEAAARAAGDALAGLTRLAGAVRPADKPLHPRGTRLTGRLVREGGRTPSFGVAWLDEPGTDTVEARLSRGLGLPAPLPDVFGLALRLRAEDDPTMPRPDQPGSHRTDLLFSTTGRGPLSRFTVLPRRSAEAWYGTLLPYRGPAGPVLLFASLSSRTAGRPAGEAGARVELWAAAGRRPPCRIGAAQLDPPGGGQDDPLISYDAALNPPPGLPAYPWVRALREGSYAAARHSRHGSPR